MKMLICFLLLAMPAAAQHNYEPTWVAISTFTPGAALTTPFGFSNNSSTLDVYVKRVQVASCSTGTYAGGGMQYWIYASTTIITGGTSQVSYYAYSSANATNSSNIIASTGPVGIVFEGKQSRQLPILRPCYINNDESSGANFQDTCFDSFAVEAEQPIKLPARAHRGLVFEQRRLGTADITDGCVMVRITYTSEPD